MQEEEEMSTGQVGVLRSSSPLRSLIIKVHLVYLLIPRCETGLGIELLMFPSQSTGF